MNYDSIAKHRMRGLAVGLFGIVLMASGSGRSVLAEPQGQKISLADGKIQLTAPADWVAKEPKFKSIVNYEFAVEAAEGDTGNGRVTIGGAGGGVRANLDRWKAQFVVADGQSAEEKKLQVAGQTVHYLDVSGTYRPPPFLGQPPQSDYRMLGAIIETDGVGSYYVRFYGPQRTVRANEQAFMGLVESLQVK